MWLQKWAFRHPSFWLFIFDVKKDGHKAFINKRDLFSFVFGCVFILAMNLLVLTQVCSCQ